MLDVASSEKVSSERTTVRRQGEARTHDHPKPAQDLVQTGGGDVRVFGGGHPLSAEGREEGGRWMPSTWTAKGVLVFPVAREEEFRAAQRAKKGMKRFFKRTNTAFFDQWENQDDKEYEDLKPLLTKSGKISKQARQPQPQVVKKFATTEEWKKDREKKIKAWFYNRTVPSRRNRSRINLKVGFGKAGKQRVLSEENLYSKRYYATRVKPAVDRKLAEVDDNDMCITVTRQILWETWLKENVSTRKEIKDLRKELLKAVKDEEEEIQRLLDGEHIPGSLDPEELLLMQQAMPDIMHKILKMIASLTGWSASMVVGGPDMRKVNGELTVRSFHIGAGVDMLTWKEHVPNIDERWAKLYREFLREAYSETERLRLAVEIDSKFIKNPQSLANAHWGDGCLVLIDPPDTPEEEEAQKRRETTEAAKQSEKRTEDPTESTGPSAEDDMIKEGQAGGDEDEHKGGDESLGDENDGEGGGNKGLGDGNEGDKAVGERTLSDIVWTVENGILIPLLNDTGDVENVYNCLPLDAGARVPYNVLAETGVSFDATDLKDPTLFSFDDTFTKGLDYTPKPVGGGFSSGYSGGYTLPPVAGDALNEIEGAKWANLGMVDDVPDKTRFLNGGFDFGNTEHGGESTGGRIQWSWMPGTDLNGGTFIGGAVGGGGENVGDQVVDGRGKLAGEAVGGREALTAGGPAPERRETPIGGELGVVGGVTGAVSVGKADEPPKGKEQDPNGKASLKEVPVGVNPDLDLVSGKAGGKRKRSGEHKATNLQQSSTPNHPPKEKHAKKHMLGGISNEMWTQLVDRWYEFEMKWARKGMVQSGRVPVANRSDMMRTWLVVPWDYDSIPDVSEVESFAMCWIRWWNGMQLAARKGEDGKMPKILSKGMDIGGLKKGSHLGIVVVVIALRWWGGHQEVVRKWEEAVEDLLAMLNQFLA
ncbi:hypothetical protein FA13DRAFT_1709218 [Coprinellus micaceus]|uniref:Uncharacterized protein n=1 Tax=Coprinellus micaceus TaxID=71717 RepID=A0A4Y7TE13_COPMI|nr:hypothetical protein FA13DRAFT_1709218 [Coprinellus micaceus]